MSKQYRTASGSERDKDPTYKNRFGKRLQKSNLYPARYRSRFCNYRFISGNTIRDGYCAE